MCTLRPFTCKDLFRFNRVNFDPLTENYGTSFYLQVIVRRCLFFWSVQRIIGGKALTTSPWNFPLIQRSKEFTVVMVKMDFVTHTFQKSHRNVAKYRSTHSQIALNWTHCQNSGHLNTATFNLVMEKEWFPFFLDSRQSDSAVGQTVIQIWSSYPHLCSEKPETYNYQN